MNKEMLSIEDRIHLMEQGDCWAKMSLRNRARKIAERKVVIQHPQEFQRNYEIELKKYGLYLGKISPLKGF